MKIKDGRRRLALHLAPVPRGTEGARGGGGETDDRRLRGPVTHRVRRREKRRDEKKRRTDRKKDGDKDKERKRETEGK